MRTFLIALLLLLGILIPTSSNAQTSHAASQAAIDEALQQRTASTNADRERALNLLKRPEVRAIAKDAGLDIRRVESAAATLTDEELASIAAQVRAAEEGLVGGQSRITISTTMLIIGLLVLIILILALK